MRKRLFIVLLAAMLGAALFVSCDGAVKDGQEQTAMVSFSVPQGKSLGRMNEQFKPGDYFWRYTAAKADQTGLKTGETAEEADVNTDEDGIVNKGLGKVGPFSMGAWTFKLVAYREAEHTNKLYEGETSATFSRKDGNTVSVEVEPLETADGKGTIKLVKEIALKDNSGNAITKYKKTVTITNADGAVMGLSDRALTETSTTGYTEQIEVDNNADDLSYTAASGSYTVKVDFEDENDLSVGTSSVMVHVYDNLTTTVLGNLNEETAEATFQANARMAATETQPIVEGEATEFIMATTPADNPDDPTESGNTTTVKIPAGGLSGTNAQLTVTPYCGYSPDNTLFVVSSTGEEPLVWGLDLSLKVDGNQTTQFGNNKKATITTYIKPGLTKSDIHIKYQPDEGEPEDVAVTSYFKETGKLVFVTPHFSKFYVVSPEAVIYNKTNNTYHPSLKQAFAAKNMDSSQVNEFVLLKDYTVGQEEYQTIYSPAVLDMGGHTITDINTFTGGNYSYSLITVNPYEHNKEQQNTFTVTGGGTFVSNAHRSLFQVAHHRQFFKEHQDPKLIIENTTINFQGPAVNSSKQGEQDKPLIYVGYTAFSSSDKTPKVGGGDIELRSGTTINWDEAPTPVIQTHGNDTYESKIDIADGVTIKGNMYLPGNNTVTISGGTFSNSSTILYQKCGTLNISGGQFTVTQKGNGEWKHSSSGCWNTGDAIVVEACGYPSGNPTVNITGGTFSAQASEDGDGFKNCGIRLLGVGNNTVTKTAVPNTEGVVGEINNLAGDKTYKFTDLNAVQEVTTTTP